MYLNLQVGGKISPRKPNALHPTPPQKHLLCTHIFHMQIQEFKELMKYEVIFIKFTEMMDNQVFDNSKCAPTSNHSTTTPGSSEPPETVRGQL